MKKIKWVILSLVLVIGIAVFLNWEKLYGSAEQDDAEMYYGDADFVYEDSYFDTAKYNRKKSRDEAVAALSTVVNDTSVLDDTRATAANEISAYVKAEEHESIIESLVISKGFSDCVAFVGKDNACVVVSEPLLTSAGAAQITDIIVMQTGLSADCVTVIEYNASEESREPNISEASSIMGENYISEENKAVS